MKGLLRVLIFGLLIIGLVGCATIKKIVPPILMPGAADRAAAPLPVYSGPKAQISVADFEMKAAKATAEMGADLRKMLVTALLNSNRFSVLERQAQAVEPPQQATTNSNAAEQVKVQETDKPKTADLIITAAVTEFEPEASGGRGGLGGGGGVGSGVLGGLLGTSLNKARMTLDIRIVNALTSEVLATSRVPGQASEIGTGFMTGLFGKEGLGLELSAYANTPMEKAIRLCIIEAVRYISQTIPQTYYKY